MGESVKEEMVDCWSWRAMAIAREAGPNPIQRRSRVSSVDEFEDDRRVRMLLWPLVKGLLMCMLFSCLCPKEELRFELKDSISSAGELIAEGAIF